MQNLRFFGGWNYLRVVCKEACDVCLQRIFLGSVRALAKKMQYLEFENLIERIRYYSTHIDENNFKQNCLLSIGGIAVLGSSLTPVEAHLQ